MNKTYSDEQINHIRDQAVFYQCACPAQLCEAIGHIRELHQIQMKCIDMTDTDKIVHETISKCTEKNHIELEKCLTEVLQIEGWEMESLKMPEYLNKRLSDNFDD